MRDIFLSALKTEIFKDRDKLRPDYVPERLPFREKQITKLGRILSVSLRGSRPSNVFIYGHVGTGKTAVTKHVIRELEKVALEKQLPVKTAYVNCRLHDTNYRVLAEICEKLGMSVPFTGLSIAELFRRFLRSIERKEIVLITVLDEMDALVRKSGDEMLYRLVRVNSELSKSKVAVVGITNDLNLVDSLDARIKSSLGEEVIVFPPYKADELREILKIRAKEAFYPGKVREEAIELCAALAAREHGDARRALELLRIAGEIAERDGAIQVEEEHVRRAYREVEHAKVYELISSLPLHSKMLLQSILHLESEKRAELTTSVLYNEYQRRCEERGIPPVTQRRVNDLVNELEMLGVVQTKLVSRGRYGRVKLIRTKVPRSVLEAALGC